MTTDQIVPGGSLSAAIGKANEEVRQQPTDAQKRTFLFELLCYSGEWERASRQLEILAQSGPEQDVAVARYRNILAGEHKRQAVFAGREIPGMPPNAPKWALLHLQALGNLEAGKSEQALELLEQAGELAGDRETTINGTAVYGLRDADDRFGPMLEVFTGKEYSWIPFEMISSLEIGEPRNFRDLLYLPATLHLHIGPLGEVFLPVVYPGSSSSEDDQVRLGNATVWTNERAGLSIGSGQRLFATEHQEWPLLEVRSVQWYKPSDHV